MNTLLSTLRIHHRHARSLNFLGSALKVIAGTPDFDDFEETKFNQKQLMEQNDKQVEINSRINSQLQKLTLTINSVINTVNRNHIDTDKLYETILARNRISIINLNNLILSVSLAKINVIDLAILDSDELDSVIKNDDFTESSISEIMSISNIKLFQKEELLLFVIKFPKIKFICKKISIFPVVHDKTMLSIEGDNLVAKCKSGVFAVKKCKMAIFTTFCSLKNSTTCAQQLVSGRPAKCTTEFSTLEKVVTIDDGMIIINNAIADVIENNSSNKINGTYLVTFDEKVTINDTTYVNLKGVSGKNAELPNIPNINITHKQVLSLPFLHEMNIKTLNHIKELRSQAITNPILITVVAIIIIYLIIKATQLEEEADTK